MAAQPEIERCVKPYHYPWWYTATRANRIAFSLHHTDFIVHHIECYRVLPCITLKFGFLQDALSVCFIISCYLDMSHACLANDVLCVAVLDNSYANHVADRFDLRRDMSFNTKVTSMVFDESRARWTVVTDDGVTRSARFVVAATGALSAPSRPRLFHEAKVSILD